MRKILMPVVALAIVALAFASFTIAGEGKDKDKKAADAQQAAATSSAKIGEAAPAFTLHDITGKSHSLADYAGKTVVLEWINPDCPFVQRHYNLDTMTKKWVYQALREITEKSIADNPSAWASWLGTQSLQH